MFVCCAESVASGGIPVALAATPAEQPVSTGCTFCGPLVALCQKHLAGGRIKRLLNCAMFYLPKFPLVQDIKIAGIKTLQKMGKTVPKDYSLVCFDYSEETYRQEDVTCSVEQGFEMGRQLALRLMEMISTGECDDRNYTYVMKPILYDGHSIRKLKKVK